MSKFTTLVARAVANCGVALLLCATQAAAQAQPSPRRNVAPPATPAASPTPAPTEATGEPDLSIDANVTARELLFEVVPTPRVEFPGRPRRDTVWEAERTNLPPQVQPGVTYRDIGIRLKITSVFADIERIVAEALGEIPATDDAPPETDSNENARPPAAALPATTSEATQPGRALPATSLTQTSPASPPPAQTTGARGRSRSGAEARRVKP